MIKVLKYILILAILNSCGAQYQSINLNQYQNQQLFEAKLPKNLADKTIKIVIISKSGKEDNQETEAEKTFINSLESYFTKTDNIEILRSEKKIKIAEELKLYELKDEFSVNNLSAADYLIETEISEIKIGKNNIKIWSSVKIYSLPEMKLLLAKKIKYKYSAFESENALMQDVTCFPSPIQTQ